MQMCHGLESCFLTKGKYGQQETDEMIVAWHANAFWGYCGT